ncbi:UNVERIFIED_CONTAM: hypothetical protein FKN15_011954 [Acipenser sinensis]
MVRWTDQAEGAFKALANILCKDPVLAVPDFKHRFVLQTDASDVGLGAVLSQNVDGEEHPLLYLSRKLLPRERNYAIVEKECLAIKWAVESLRYYLLGREFTLITDHAPLRWMKTNKEKNARITRWFLSLQPYKFVVEHRKGKENGNADGLSRIYCLGNGYAPTQGFELRGGVCNKVIQGHYVSQRMSKYLFPV